MTRSKSGIGCLGFILLLGVGIGAWMGISALVSSIRWSHAGTDRLVTWLGDSNAHTRERARERLVKMDDTAVPALVAATRGGLAVRRAEAVLALNTIGGPKAMAAVAVKLTDENSTVAAAAEAGLVKAGANAVPPLLGALAEGDPYLRYQAARLLVAIDDKSAAKGLVRALSDDDADVRAEAATGVGSLHVVSAARKLVALLGDSDATVSKAALDAAVSLGRASGKPLLAALHSSKASVRRAAVVGLGKIRFTSSARALVARLHDKNASVRGAAANALVLLGAAAVPPLSGQLGQSAGSFRWVASNILLRIATTHPDAVKPLLALLRRGDIRGVADRYAFFIRLGHPGSETMLIRALDVYGNKTMCLDYLNCGSDKLDAGARRWASAHGYTVTTTSGYYGGPSWGSASE
jgi:HEAT repeat protein